MNSGIKDADQAVGGEIIEDSGPTDPDSRLDSRQDYDYHPPKGWKLIPEDHIGVDPRVYELMVHALKTGGSGGKQAPIHVQVDGPKQEEPKPFFQVKLLQQFLLGDVGYNLVKGQEIEYCPEGKYVQIDGEKHTALRSFLAIWRMQFGEKPDPQTVRKPIFKILNPESCPPLRNSLGKTMPRGTYPSDTQRIKAEEKHGDASYRRLPVPGETSEYNLGMTQAPQASARDLGYDPGVREHAPRGAGRIIQPQYPQQAMQQEVDRRIPSMPPRGGMVGDDGLTDRGRAIRHMSADQIERPVQRQVQQNIAGYDPPESIEDFYVESGTLGGGQIVSQVPGEPADEALEVARKLDIISAQQQSQRTRY